MNDLANGVVCLVYGRFKLAVRLEGGIGAAVEKAVGQRTAQALMVAQTSSEAWSCTHARRSLPNHSVSGQTVLPHHQGSGKTGESF